MSTQLLDSTILAGAIGNYWAERRRPAPQEVRVLGARRHHGSGPRERSGLSGPKTEKLVRLCAWTKRVELDGEWLDIEIFLQQRFGLQVTHGISEEGLAALKKELKND